MAKMDKDEIQLTYKQVLRGLSKKQYKHLRTLCRISKNLYNQGVYEQRQHYKKYLAGELPEGTSSYKEFKYMDGAIGAPSTGKDGNYKLLMGPSAQAVLERLDKNYKSFFGLKGVKSNNQYNKPVRPPKYLPKDGYNNVIFKQQSDYGKSNGYFNMSFSGPYKLKYSSPFIKIKLPEYIYSLYRNRSENCMRFNIIELIPKKNHFEIAYVYTIKREFVNKANIKELDPFNFVAIDLGINNFASCISNTGTPLIINGRILKSTNQFYNKKKARYQSELPKGQCWSNKLESLTQKRNRKIDDFMRKSAREVINYCVANNIGTLIVGRNKGWKDGINIGRKNNQKFTTIPHQKFLQKLQYLCDINQIRYIETEESYTSKSSYFDGDPLPKYSKTNQVKYKFSGTRSKGLYKSAAGFRLNADLHGAANIAKKAYLNNLFTTDTNNFQIIANNLFARVSKINIS